MIVKVRDVICVQHKHNTTMEVIEYMVYVLLSVWFLSDLRNTVLVFLLPFPSHDEPLTSQSYADVTFSDPFRSLGNPVELVLKK